MEPADIERAAAGAAACLSVVVGSLRLASLPGADGHVRPFARTPLTRD